MSAFTCRACGSSRVPLILSLGRTPLALYDPGATEPTLLRAGDRVRFRRIDRAEFDAIGRAVAARTYRPVIS